MKKCEITCDSCKRNISFTGNSIDYRLALINEKIPSRGGAVSDMYMLPLIEDNAHFCGLGCLKKWINNDRL
jgi:hypothetical protein